jgi:hypothetical protein
MISPKVTEHWPKHVGNNIVKILRKALIQHSSVQRLRILLIIAIRLCTESKNNFRTALTVHSVVCCVTRCGLVRGNKHFVGTFLKLETVRTSETPVTAYVLLSGRHKSHHCKIQGLILVFAVFKVNFQNHSNYRSDVRLIRLLDRWRKQDPQCTMT